MIDSLLELLKNPSLTALWEQELNQITESSLSLGEFMQKQNQFIQHLMQVCLQQGMKIGTIEIKKYPKYASPMAKLKG